MVWIKRLSILVAGLLALIIAVLAYVILFVNPNDFKNELKAVAYEKANITLRLDGDISWSFFPWLGLSLDDIGVALGKDAEIVEFDRVEFGLAILPLLKRTIQVDRVKLINLKANLLVDNTGKANWQHTMPVKAPVANVGSNGKPVSNTNGSSSMVTSHPVPASGENKSLLSLPNIQLDELLIENAQIQYRDEKNNQQLLSKLNIKLSDVTWDKAWPMAMDLVVTHSDLQGRSPLKVSVKLSANLAVFPEREALALDSLVLSAEAQSSSLPVSPLKVKLSAPSVDMDLPQENIFIDGLALSGLGVNLDGKVQAYEVLSDPQFTASFSLGEFNPRDVMKSLNIVLPAMSDPKVLTKAQLDMTLEGSAHSITAQSISLRLDDTNLEMNGVMDLAPLHWDVSLAGANLDLDRYLPAPVEVSKTTPNTSVVTAQAEVVPAQAEVGNRAPSASSATLVSDLIPVDLVRSLNGHVELVFKNIIVKKLKIDQLSLDSTQANGLVKVEPIKASLYQGSVVANARLDVRGKTPHMDVQPSISDVEIQPLLMDFMAMDKISGTTHLNGEFSARGNQFDALMSSLQGDVLVDIKNGALVGTNLTKSVCQGIAAIRKETINEDAFGADTPFDTMTFPAHIVNGVVSTPGLKMSSAGLLVTGDGVVSLPESSLNYQANVAVVGSELDRACRVNEKMAQLSFPIVCNGQFSDDPAGLCRPDLKGFATLFAKLAKDELKIKADEEKARLKEQVDKEKARLQEKIEQEKETAKDKLKEKLKDKFKSLF